MISPPRHGPQRIASPEKAQGDTSREWPASPWKRCLLCRNHHRPSHSSGETGGQPGPLAHLPTVLFTPRDHRGCEADRVFRAHGNRGTSFYRNLGVLSSAVASDDSFGQSGGGQGINWPPAGIAQTEVRGKFVAMHDRLVGRLELCI